VITVHHLNNSRSQRVLWLLEELGLPYEIVKYERTAMGLAPPELANIHPLGKSPVITDGEVKVAESAAILEYLVDKAGGKLSPPPGTQAHRDYRYFMHYAEGSLMPLLLMRLIFNRVKAGAPFLVRPIAKGIAGKVDGGFVAPNLGRHIAFLSEHLSKRTWFAGDTLTAADAQMSFPMEAILARVPDLPPVFRKYVEQMKARPAFARALEKGGAYSVMD